MVALQLMTFKIELKVVGRDAYWLEICSFLHDKFSTT